MNKRKSKQKVRWVRSVSPAIDHARAWTFLFHIKIYSRCVWWIFYSYKNTHSLVVMGQVNILLDFCTCSMTVMFAFDRIASEFDLDYVSEMSAFFLLFFLYFLWHLNFNCLAEFNTFALLLLERFSNLIHDDSVCSNYRWLSWVYHFLVSSLFLMKIRVFISSKNRWSIELVHRK